MSGHTPGPWNLDETDPGTFEVYGKPNGFCADIVVSQYFHNPDDARLIAAAPELLEALEALLSATEEVGYVHYAPMRAKARAAIAKAREQ